MVNPLPLIATVPTDTWIKADWEAFITFADDPTLVKGRFYYDDGDMRIEMSPLGTSHGRDNTVIPLVINLYAAVQNLSIVGLTNTSFRKLGVQEAQPDLAFYIGSDLRLPPRNNAPVNLNEASPPTLVIEIAATSLQDDLTRKKTLYQRLGVQEYWVVNVNASQVIAFSLTAHAATDIRYSQVLSGLAIDQVEAALKRSQSEDDGAVSRWLLNTFQA